MPIQQTRTGISNWRDAAALLKRHVPDVFIKGKFNFITIHYFYIISLTIIYSVIIFGIGGMPYIDALFFASGACTQSGLNTIDVDLLYTGQQVCFYMAAMMTNPIVIHGSVVFIRLYWFEKRFEDVVKDARNLRRTKSRARSISAESVDVEAARNQGIKDKAIEVLRRTGRRFSSIGDGELKHVAEAEKSSVPSSQSSPEASDHSKHEISPCHSAAESMEEFRTTLPSQMSPEHHIRFLEKQRDTKDDITYRVPSPREFDRGGNIRNINEELGDEICPARTRGTDSNAPTQGITHHLTFNEPEIVRDRPRGQNLPKINTKPMRSHNSRMTADSRTAHSLKRSWTLGSRTATIEKMPYLSYEPTVTRNSFFVNLTEEQREELGGIEYRALKTLAIIIVSYFFGFHLLGILSLTPWILRDSRFGAVVDAAGQGRVWWGFFTAQSAFNDLGFTLTADSMNSFAEATWPLLIMSFLIIIGNTGFPCMLRFVIWCVSLFTTPGSGLYEEIQFLLDHPRRCFTLLFPRAATWWLFAILVILNGLDLIFFIILDLNDSVVTSLPGWFQFLDGLFQAASTRTAGFAVVNISLLHPAIQVSYLIMMYISAFPIAISMRRTNVYEERSLGIYATLEEEGEDGKEPSYVGAHIRKQLSFDLWYIFLGLFIVAIVEGGRLQQTTDYAFTLFTCLFEIVSAYGTVGLSLGYTGINASFSAEFKPLSKLIIIAMQIRGRHRGLPYELDRAVLLPSESLHLKERKEAERQVNRRPSLAMSTMSAVEGQLRTPNFRQEVGISSGADTRSGQHPQEQHDEHQPQSPTQAHHETLHSGGVVRRGFGSMMHGVASARNKIADGSFTIR